MSAISPPLSQCRLEDPCPSPKLSSQFAAGKGARSWDEEKDDDDDMMMMRMKNERLEQRVIREWCDTT